MPKMDAERDSSEFMQDEFGLKIVSLLTANVNHHCKNGALPWEKMAKEMGEIAKTNVQWKKLRTYFERHVLLQLGNFINDQQMIDRLQYAYLEKVYKISVLFQRIGPKLANSSIVNRNKLLIKYAIDDRYDAEVVHIFKRLHNKRNVRKISINVMDPVYELRPLLQKFLLKPLWVRKRERLQWCFSSMFGTLPLYPQTDVAMEQINHRACVEASTSGILFDDASVRIEDASLPNPCSTEFSPCDLLENESLTIPTREFHRMQQLENSAVDGEIGSNSAERNTTPDRTAPASSPDFIIPFSSEEEKRKGSESGSYSSSDNSVQTVIFKQHYNKSAHSRPTLAVTWDESSSTEAISTRTHKRVATFPGTIGTTKQAKTVSALHTTMDQNANRNQSVKAEMRDECVPNVSACGLTITCFNRGGCNHEAALPSDSVVPLYHLIPDSIFDSTDDEEEAEKSDNGRPSPNSPKDKNHPAVKVENTNDLCHSAPADGTCNKEAGLPSDAEKQEYLPLYHLIPDSIFDSTDEEEEDNSDVCLAVCLDHEVEDGNSGNGGPSPNAPEINVEDNIDVCQIVCSAPADETVPVRTGVENLQEEIVQPNESASTEPVGLANCSTELAEVLAASATHLPVISVGRLSVERVAQIESKLGPMLTAKKNIYQTLRLMAPKLFFRPFSTDDCLTLSNRLTIMQLLATSMDLTYGQPVHLLPILYRIAYGDFHDIRQSSRYPRLFS